jgi:hypothetical protein
LCFSTFDCRAFPSALLFVVSRSCILVCLVSSPITNKRPMLYWRKSCNFYIPASPSRFQHSRLFTKDISFGPAFWTQKSNISPRRSNEWKNVFR